MKRHVWLIVASGLLLAAGAAVCASTRLEVGGHAAANGVLGQRNESVVLYADSIVASPKATQQIQLSVIGTAVLDAATGYYHYSYTVQNLAGSTNAVTRFGVGPLSSEPLTVDAPDHWSGFWGYQDMANSVVWAETDSGVPPPGWQGSPNNIYPSGFEIQPGQALVFAFDTPVPPIMNAANFYAQGFDTLSDDLSLDDSSPSTTLFQEGVFGTTIAPGDPTGVAPGPGDQRVITHPPIPNPATKMVAIGFDLPVGGRISLGVYNLAGRRVKLVADQLLPKGFHSITWDTHDDNGKRVPPGAYFYRLTIDGKQIAERRVVIVL